MCIVQQFILAFKLIVYPVFLAGFSIGNRLTASLAEWWYLSVGSRV